MLNISVAQKNALPKQFQGMEGEGKVWIGTISETIKRNTDVIGTEKHFKMVHCNISLSISISLPSF